MNHRAIGIGLQRLLEALDGFVVIEAIAPIQTHIEPALGFCRSGRDDAPIGPEIETIHAVYAIPQLLARQVSWRIILSTKSVEVMPRPPMAAPVRLPTNLVVALLEASSQPAGL